MSNVHESDYLIELKGFSKDLEYLAVAVEKSTKMFADNNDKYNYLSQKITSLKQSQEQQEKLINELKKVLLDNPESKQTGLLTEVRDLKHTFINYTKQIEKDKQESKERAIEREKEKLAEEEKREKAFNRKIAILGILIGFFGVTVPTITAFILYKWSLPK